MEIDYRIHLNEFSASKSLYWKQSKKQKLTVSKETIGFVVRMATISSYIKPRSTARFTIIGYSIPQVILGPTFPVL